MIGRGRKCGSAKNKCTEVLYFQNLTLYLFDKKQVCNSAEAPNSLALNHKTDKTMKKLFLFIIGSFLAFCATAQTLEVEPLVSVGYYPVNTFTLQRTSIVVPALRTALGADYYLGRMQGNIQMVTFGRSFGSFEATAEAAIWKGLSMSATYAHEFVLNGNASRLTNVSYTRMRAGVQLTYRFKLSESGE